MVRETLASEVAEGMLAAASEEAEKALGDRKKSPRTEKRNKGHLPAHLERIEQVIEPDSTLCPCGCGEMVKVGVVLEARLWRDDRSERLDVIPARFRVLVTVRPKYLCRSCDGASHVQAPAPEWLVPRGLPTEALVASPWSPSSATTFHSTGRRTSTAARASTSTGPCWRPGRDARRSCWVSGGCAPRGIQLDGWKFQGIRSSMRLLGWPFAIASSVALR